MEKYMADKHTGLKYELVGAYYLIAGPMIPFGIRNVPDRSFFPEPDRYIR